MPHVVPPAAQTPIDITDDRARLDLTRILELEHPDRDGDDAPAL